jgi:preprotein translocase subunit SecD
MTIKLLFILIACVFIDQVLIGQIKPGMYLAIPSSNDSGAYEVTDKRIPEYYKLGDSCLLSFIYVDSVYKAKNELSGVIEINIKFNAVGQKLFARITENNLQKQLGIVINNKLVCAPKIMGPIVGGSITIVSSFSEQQVDDFITGIKNEIDKLKHNQR